VVEFGAEPIAAVDTHHPVEGWRLAELESDQDLDGDVPGPADEVAKVHPVVEDPVQKGVRGDGLGDLGGDGSHSRDLADLAFSHIAPASLCDFVAHEHYELGTASAARARAGQQRRIGVGEMGLERLLDAALSGGARQASGLGLGPGDDRRTDVGFQGEMDVGHAELV
jgi:hypothetical protein